MVNVKFELLVNYLLVYLLIIFTISVNLHAYNLCLLFFDYIGIYLIEHVILDKLIL